MNQRRSGPSGRVLELLLALCVATPGCVTHAIQRDLIGSPGSDARYAGEERTGVRGDKGALLAASALLVPALAIDVVTYPVQAFAAIFLGVDVGY